MANPDGSAMFTGNIKVPVGGDVMAHSSTTRLQFKKGRGENRICKLFCSPHSGEQDATFAITNVGITDSNDWL